MESVTVSPKYQVVIPKAIREALGISVGQKLRVVAHEGSISLVAQQSMTAYRGMFPGMPTDFTRERH